MIAAQVSDPRGSAHVRFDGTSSHVEDASDKLTVVRLHTFLLEPQTVEQRNELGAWESLSIEPGSATHFLLVLDSLRALGYEVTITEGGDLEI